MPTAVFERRGVESTPATEVVQPSAVVWINGRGAIVASMDWDRRVTTCTIERGLEPEPSYLDLVINAIGDRDRVVILGPGTIRLALERAYTAIFHRPDRLVDVEPAGPVGELELIQRVRELAGA